MPFTAAARAEIKARDRLYLAKLILRLFTLIFASIAVGTFAWVLSRSFTDGFFYEDIGITFTYFVFIPLGITILYFALHLIYLQFRRRPVHPGWDVGVDLILWLVYVVFSIFIFTGALSSYYDVHNGYGGYSDGDYGDYGSVSTTSSYNASSATRIVNTQLTGASSLLALVALHFALFVWACVSTEAHRRSRYNHSARAIAEEMISDMRQRGELPPVAQPLLASGEDGHAPVRDAVRDAHAPATPYRDGSPAPQLGYYGVGEEGETTRAREEDVGFAR